MPCLKYNIQENGKARKAELSLQEFRDLLEGDVKANCQILAFKL